MIAHTCGRESRTTRRRKLHGEKRLLPRLASSPNSRTLPINLVCVLQARAGTAVLLALLQPLAWIHIASCGRMDETKESGFSWAISLSHRQHQHHAHDAKRIADGRFGISSDFGSRVSDQTNRSRRAMVPFVGAHTAERQDHSLGTCDRIPPDFDAQVHEKACVSRIIHLDSGGALL